MTRARLLLALAACAIAATTAAAEPPAHKKPKPKDAAEAAYVEGRRHYDLREWDEAIASFKESYRLRADERSLFNIAQSYRLKGDCVEALGFYQTYKRNFPDADGNAAVDKLIADIDPCVRAHAGAATPPPTGEPPADDHADKPAPDAAPPPPPHARVDASVSARPAPIEAPPEPHPGRTLRVTGIVLGAIGLAAIGGGAGFALEAQSKSNQVGSGTGVFDHQLQADGQAANRDAEISFAAGGALAVTGVVLYVIGRRSPAEHLAILPRAGGGTLAWRGSF